MKRLCASAVTSALLVFTFIAGGAARAVADVQIDLGFRAGTADVDFFYDALSPYGDWIEMAPYGWVWAPRSVAADWRPYRRGHWTSTAYDRNCVRDTHW